MRSWVGFVLSGKLVADVAVDKSSIQYIHGNVGQNISF